MRTVYLIRHGVAEARGPAWPDDSERPLTREGEAKVKGASRGLRHLGVVVDLILTSPSVRARCTADLVADALAPRPDVVELKALEPGGGSAEVLREVAARRDCRVLALVGHDPGVTEMAALLTGVRSLDFRKGAVCRIDLEEGASPLRGCLRWFATAKILRAIK